MTLTEKIATFLNLKAERNTYPGVHGSSKGDEVTITRYYFNNDWHVDLTPLKVDAVRECFRKLDMAYWPVDYAEAKENIEHFLDNQ